jgi:hypothetical protein
MPAQALAPKPKRQAKAKDNRQKHDARGVKKVMVRHAAPKPTPKIVPLPVLVKATLIDLHVAERPKPGFIVAGCFSHMTSSSSNVWQKTATLQRVH